MTPARPANAEAFRAALELVIGAGRTISMLDLPAMLQMMERTDALGPVLDPTLYREKHRAMESDRQILEATLPLWRLARRAQLDAEPSQIQHRPVLAERGWCVCLRCWEARRCPECGRVDCDGGEQDCAAYRRGEQP
jgi:hypothetical protein